ncbi:hypothetical protein [Rhodanobacter lindaniclasticus]
MNDLTVTLDYYKIKIDNAIQRIDGSTKLAVCYNTPGLSHPFCSASNFTRNRQTGEIDFLSAQPVNAASERLSVSTWGRSTNSIWPAGRHPSQRTCRT